MRRWTGLTGLAVLAAALVVAVPPTWAQDREYHVSGKVLDATQQPLAGAIIEMRERTTRRGYRTTSEADGRFKLVGLPHGVYEVKVSKAGYQARTAEWDLHEAQDTLKKAEFTPFVLLSETQVKEIQQHTKLKTALAEATGLIQKGDFDAALRVLTTMLAESPDDVNALYLTGLCRLQKKQLDEAAASLEKVTQLAPSFAAARVQLGALYEQRGEKDRALASYDAALQLEPDNLMALYNTGVLRYNAGNAAEALPYFERAVRVKPDDDNALEMAGYCQLQALKYPEALQYLERARALVTDPARAATLDDVLKELRPRVQGTPGPGKQ